MRHGNLTGEGLDKNTMGSPKKTKTTESGSPTFARFIAGSVRRRQSPGTKSSLTSDTTSVSTQKAKGRWSPRKITGFHRDTATASGTSIEALISSNSSSSSSNHIAQRHRSIEAAKKTPEESLGSREYDDDVLQENSASSANKIVEKALDERSLKGKLNSFLSTTPSSRHKTFGGNLDDPSPDQQSTVSTVGSKLSRVSQSKLDVPNLHNHQESTHFDTRNFRKLKFDDAETPKSSEISENQKRNTSFDFWTSNDFRHSPNRIPNGPSNHIATSDVEVPSSPLISRTLSAQIQDPYFASDQSETIEFQEESTNFLYNGEPHGDKDSVSDDRAARIVGQRRVLSTRSTGGQDEFVQIIRRDRSVAELHSLCMSMTTVDDVIQARSCCVQMSPENLTRQDFRGETPLHAFSNNKTLAVHLMGNVEFETKDFLVLYRQPTIDQEASLKLNEHVSKFLVGELLPSFPGATMTHDNKGFIPFEEGLTDWIATSQKANDGDTNENDYYSMYLASYTNAVSDAVSQAWKSTSTTFLTAVSKMTESEHRNEPSQDVERGGSGSLHQVSSKDELTGNNGTSTMSSKTKLSPHARFCLQMLSLIIDCLERASGVPSKLHSSNFVLDTVSRGQRQLQRLSGAPNSLGAQIVAQIASIPNILPTILSISEDVEMEFAMSTTIIRRVLTSKYSIGSWLTSMLQSSNRNISRRAIDYLQIVSKLCCEDEKARRQSRGDQAPTCDSLIDEVSRLRDFVPSLLSLGENGMEEVSTTKVVSDVLDKKISTPFVATVVLCDAIFLALMIVGFRFAVNGMIMGGSLENVLRWIYVANIGIFYFLIQEIGKVVSLLLLSSHSRKYFLSFWNLIDVLAILLALASSVAMRWQFAIHLEGLEDANTLRGLLAVSTGFLWLRVLSFLKSINIQLATFILAIITISKDILFFCVILLILVVSFSQMFYTLLAPTSCATDGDQRQCHQTEYLIQFYIMLLGDFGNTERATFSTGFSVFLLVLYSFLVTVILLNVLIAIAGDSYEKCLLNSRKLFGRARVMLVAELVSFQSLLQKRDPKGDELDCHNETELGIYSHWWMSGNWSLTRKWSRGSILFFGLSMLVTLVWTVAELVGFSTGEKYVSIISSLSSVFINFALYVTVVLFLDRNSVSTKNVSDNQKEWSNSLQRAVLRMLGASQDKKTDSQSRRKKRKGQEEWHGRLSFLQREMDRIAEKQTELLCDHSDNLQNMVSQSESRMRAELSSIEDRFRETNCAIVSAVDELKALISMSETSAPGLRSPIPEEVEIGFK